MQDKKVSEEDEEQIKVREEIVSLARAHLDECSELEKSGWGNSSAFSIGEGEEIVGGPSLAEFSRNAGNRRPSPFEDSRYRRR